MNKNLYRLIAGNYRSAEIQLRGECIKIIKCLTICFILGLFDNFLLGLYNIINIYQKYIDKGENVLWEKRKEILQMDY
jgi:hypothetical protein